jgi:hypothetical protein
MLRQALIDAMAGMEALFCIVKIVHYWPTRETVFFQTTFHQYCERRRKVDDRRSRGQFEQKRSKSRKLHASRFASNPPTVVFPDPINPVSTSRESKSDKSEV